jgi:extracellular factor (EF) 3-hydroxypalmitic acid methyl ester biosynthesis protein
MSAVPSKLSVPRQALTEAILSTRLGVAEYEVGVNTLLNHAHHLLLDSNGNRAQVGQALDELFGGLYRHKLESSEQEWKACVQQCRTHPLCSTIHEDPFTARAFMKPRGYAGDAELLDLIYGPEERWPDPVATALGLDIYRYTVGAPAAEGVRARRAFVADLVDRATADNSGQHILAIAAGHLREAQMAAAVRRRRFGRFVALDADPVSLKEVARAYGPYGVETVAAPFSALVTNRVRLGQFDLIYSTGLFDYLSNSTGRRLVTTLFGMLNPGGQLVVANFMPGIRDVGYMEAFMDWNLIYRTRQDMVELTMEIPESEIRDLTVFAEDSRNIIFVRVTKA